ncbi:unnamed protein product [Peniophora sp. CBMAI 1063]|nr:unnamed protein product [Peniophora sp. CBMAI 1063]
MLAISLFFAFALPSLVHSFHSHSSHSHSQSTPANSSTPSGWNTTTSLTTSERQTLAQDAAERLLPAIDPLTGRIDTLSFSSQDVNLAAVLALQDYHSGTHAYEEILGNMFAAYFSTHNDSFLSSLPCVAKSLTRSEKHGNNEDIQWGLSAYYAYRAYSNESFHNIAKDSWERVSAYIIGAENTRDVRADGLCPSSRGHLDEQPNIGAVFMFRDAANDTTVNTQTMGPFMALGAYLYESNTSDTRYLALANLTGNYLRRHLYNGAIMLDTSTVATCTLDNTTILTYNTGYTLEGISILANQSFGGDNGSELQMYSDWLNDMVPSAINFAGWTGSDGVILEENADPDNWQSGLKAVLVRGLLEARSRNANATWAPLVDDFITVQFNALLASVEAGSNDTYPTDWRMVSNSTLDYPGSIAALDVLNAAIATRSSNSSDSSFHWHGESRDDSHDGRHKGNTTTIVVVAVVVGGVVVLALIAAAIVLVRRRNKHAATFREMQEIDAEQPSPTPIDPFVLDKESTSQSVSLYNEKGGYANLGYGAADATTQWYQASIGPTAPPSSIAGTSTSEGSYASSHVLGIATVLQRGTPVFLATSHLEQDAHEGASPPRYQDAAT